MNKMETNITPTTTTTNALQMEKMEVDASINDNNNNNNNNNNNAFSTSSLFISFVKRRPKSTICYALIVLFVIILIATGNPVYAMMFLFMYFCLLYAWENIFRLAWLETDEERKTPIPLICCKGKIIIKREVVCYTIWSVYLFIAFSSATVGSRLSGSEPNAYVTFSYSILGSMGVLFLSVTLVDIFDALRRIITRCRNIITKKTENIIIPNEKKINQLKSCLSIGIWIILSICALANGYDKGWTIKVEVYLKKLPSCLDGFKIGLLSDMHAGVLIGKNEIAQHVAMMNEENLDIVILSGDMADGSPTIVSGALEPIINDLKTKFGIYYSTGNHEYMHGTGTAEEQGAKWEQWWEKNGVVVLHNNVTRVPSRIPYNSNCNETFDLVGVPDRGHGPKLKDTLKKTSFDPSRAKILIAHQPLEIIEAAKEKVDLQLSGHTHAGHIFPLQILISLSNRGYIHGLDTLDETQLYTSAGTTGWGPRTRLWSFNERTVLTLRSGAKDHSSGDTYRTSLSIGIGLSAFVFIAFCASCINRLCLPPITHLKNHYYTK